MPGRTGQIALVITVGALLTSPGVHAAPAPEALVIGNGTYSSMPPVQACLLSAHAVAAALRGLGFDVVEREDASSGGTDAAIGDFMKRVSDAPATPSFIYACGYATAFNDRPFLLPVSANLSRPADALTQGVLAKSLIDALGRSGAGPSFVAFDVVSAPGAPAALGLDTLSANLPASTGLIAVSQAKPADTPTPLATLLGANLKGPQMPVAGLVSAVQQQLSANQSVTLAAVHQPATPGYLVGAPAQAPAPATAAPATPAPAPAATAVSAPLPADENMTDADRRRVQTALAKLGYYDGKVDGIFGPDSRAAIRRFQHELHADMTGRLTAEQATRLVSGK